MGPLIDLTGQQKGKWTVLRRAPPRTNTTSAWWVCRCECGAEHDIPGQNLREGRTHACRSCAHIHSRAALIRSLRGRHYKIHHVARIAGCHPLTVCRVAPGGRRWTPMVPIFSEVRRLHRAGNTLQAIWDEHYRGRYRHIDGFKTAYTREYVYRAKDRYRGIWAVSVYTAQGLSADAIATALGYISYRTVVRYRKLKPPILQRDRIAKWRALDVEWWDINKRLDKPFPDWRDLQAWAEVMEEFEMADLLGQAA